MSLRNAIIVGLTFGVTGWLSFELLTRIISELQSGTSLSVAIFERGAGLVFIISSIGLLAASWYGGFDLIQHFTLRFILWRTGRIPWNLARFLNHATDLIFLRKVGGGYIFIHRLLLEHFAAMGTAESAEDNDIAGG